MGKNSICHLEISAKDALKTSEFYKELFGWKISAEMGEEYIFFQPESGPGGAICKNPEFSPSTGVVAYIEVDDINAHLGRATELGGKQVTPKTDIPGHGWFGQFNDPEGNLIGLFTGKSE